MNHISEQILTCTSSTRPEQSKVYHLQAIIFTPKIINFGTFPPNNEEFNKSTGLLTYPDIHTVNYPITDRLVRNYSNPVKVQIGEGEDKCPFPRSGSTAKIASYKLQHYLTSITFNVYFMSGRYKREPRHT